MVSTNVPLDHWSYRAVEKLADYGLIDSAMLTVKPVSRVEMARHIGQAMVGLKREDDPPQVLLSIVEKLKQEFKAELIQMGLLDGWHGDSFIKPVEDPYLRYVYADSRPDLENVRGDVYRRGSNVRLGFASRARLSRHAAVYVHPEYVDSAPEGDSDVELVEAYAKGALGPYELQVGKDSLWWGPGRHGSILMSNNAQPLGMVKIATSEPTPLPWIFKPFGLCKFTWFVAELERNRDIPEAKLTGLRINVKPSPRLELGISRVAMFNGKGQPGVGIWDYLKIFLPSSEQEETNQLAGFDASYRLSVGRYLPMRSVKGYMDFAGEDEASFMPAKWGGLWGVQLNDLFKTGRTDLRIEYADNHVSGSPNVFYNHSLYTSGYTYEGRVMGHHMGTDSRDVFVQLSHYLTDDMIVDIAFDRQTHRLSADTQRERDILECDLTVFPCLNWRIRTGYRFEDAAEGQADNHVFHFQLIREF